MSKVCSKKWGWKISGLMLGFIFLATIIVVKPIGVSTQFVILNGIVWNSISPDLVKKDNTAKKGYSSTNPYLNKSGGKYAKSVAKPINYSFIFVIAMIIGGFIASILGGKNDSIPKVVEESQGKSLTKRLVFSAVGGFLVLFGARLAGGCSSGHMMSGMMQTSISGYIFAAATFIVAIPVAMIIYKKKEV